MTPLYIVLAVAVVALIVLVTILLIQRSKKKKKERQMAQMAGEEAQGPGADEISLLVRDADAKIAAAKIQPGARLATLPAYLIMGDAGSTKTSVMIHSGLDPELMAGQVYQGGNVAPTRTANFWFSRKSVFVEAGGKLTTEPPKWAKLVSRLAPKTSVVGKGEQAPRAVVVCYDIENFTKMGAPDIAANSARTLRARLGEISQSMGIQLPVYVLFTRADRLPFFTEYVRNLTNEEATQVVGVTLPMIEGRSEGVYAEQETARLTGNFEALFRSLADARPEFLARETDATKLPAAYEFPREFRKLRPMVVQFLVDLCRPSQLTVGPFLRGFYFTGVRPIIINEAAPVQAAAPQQQAGYGSAHGATGIFNVGAMAAAQQAAPSPVAQTRKVPQWLFLGHFFHNVLLADAAAMGASGASTKTSFWRRFLFAVAAGLCFLFLIGFTVSFFNNRSLEGQVRDAALNISSIAPTEGALAPVDSLRKLENLRKVMATLVKYRRDGAPFFYKWFLYVGNDLYPEARKVYFDKFRPVMFSQTQDTILSNLRALPSTAGDPSSYTPTYNDLKAYLITTSNPEHSTSDFLTPVLFQRWENGRSVDPEREQLARNQFDFYATELPDGNPYSPNNDAAAIAHARAYLAQFAGAQPVYAYMRADASKANPPIDFNKQFPGSDQTVREAHVVEGAFSKAGWGFMMGALARPDKYIYGEKWVLGETGTGNIDKAKVLQDVRTLYTDDFINEWRTYLKQGSLVRYTSLKDASEKLNKLAANTSPLLELIALASRNTDVDDPAVKKLFQPPQSVVPPNTTDVVIAPPNQPYMQGLTSLQTAIDQIASTPGTPSDTAAGPARDAAGQAKNSARQLELGFLPDPASVVDKRTGTLLEDPITSVMGLLGALPVADMNARGAGMCGQLSATLRKYPFSPKAAEEATLPEVVALYKPKDGAIWQFYETALQKVIVRSGSQYSQAPGGGMNINPAFISFLNRSQAFTDLAFPPGSTDPQFKYTVTALSASADVSKITLIVDGQTQTVTPGAAGAPFAWPGTGQHSLQLKLTYKDGSTQTLKQYDGLWSIFHFIGEADRHEGTQIEFRPVSGNQPVRGPSGQPVVVRLDVVPNPNLSFTGLGCVSEVAKP